MWKMTERLVGCIVVRCCAVDQEEESEIVRLSGRELRKGSLKTG